MSSGSSGFSNVPFNDFDSPLSPSGNPNPNADADASAPWGSDQFSIPDSDNEFSYFDDPFESDSLFIPEASTSRFQGQTRQQTPPPSNQQASRSRNILNSPDPFSEFVDIPSPAPDTTRASSFIDLTENPIVDLTDSPEMAPNRKRKREAESEAPSRKAPRRGASTGTPPKPQKSKETEEVVDLANIEEESQYEEFKNKQQAELIKQQQQDEATRPVKLSDFNCIICMDNPTDLTVTHCGHLFCSECLHEALHAGNNEKKSCPVCRTTVSTAMVGRGPDKKPAKNSFFHLEMKLMTANRKGKMPQGRA